MSLLKTTAYTLRPHVRPSLMATGCQAAVLSASHGGSFSRRPALTAPGRRGIHVSALAADTIQATADAFSYIHANLGVPWYLTIPLLAVGVNVTFRLPLQFYAAKIRQKRTELHPLLMAWMHRHSRDIIRQQPNLPERIKTLRISGSVEKSRRRIYKAWGAQRYKSFAPLLGIVPFVTISEALRRKCGAPLGWISQKVGVGKAGTATAGFASAGSMVDPSLADGGCLWFTDLTSADPYFGLPIICSGILAWNAWHNMTKDQLRGLLALRPTQTKVPISERIRTVFGRIMLVIPLFPLLFADLPSAIFLYWASSFGLAGVNEAIISRFAPRKDPKFLVERKETLSSGYLKSGN